MRSHTGAVRDGIDMDHTLADVSAVDAGAVKIPT